MPGHFVEGSENHWNQLTTFSFKAVEELCRLVQSLQV